MPPSLRMGENDIDKIVKSNIGIILYGLKGNEKFVFGHTHKSYVESNIGNTGSWCGDEREYNTYIKIKDGKMEKRVWGGDILI